jgi:cytochrome c553
MRTLQKVFVLVAVALVSSGGTPCSAATPNGDDIAHQGAATVPACTACHGFAFQGQPAIKAPPLAGLPSGFIIARLEHYAGPTGHNAAMRAVAQGLTDAERQAVAKYLAMLPRARAQHDLKDVGNAR